MDKPQTTIGPDARLKFHTALLAFHIDMDELKVRRDESNPFFKSKYVPLPKMLAAVRPIAHKHGFILSQPLDIINTTTGAKNIVTTFLTHAETGLNEPSKAYIQDQPDMQKFGLAVTYGRRQSLSSLIGLEEADDDGNELVGNKVAAPKAGRAAAVSTKDKF